MKFTIEGLKEHGFIGFQRVIDLWDQGYDIIPAQKGIYAILRESYSQPEFLQISVGGWFKGKDPTIAISELENRWINGAELLYLGKAGGSGQDSMLNSRLSAYLRFGQGKRYAHRGGRYIWQLIGHENLIVAYKPLVNDQPRTVEKEMIQEFAKIYGKKPFANIQS